MSIKPGDRVTVAGAQGVHVVKEIADVLYPLRRSALIVLGESYGRYQRGDTISVDLFECSVVPADLEDFPRGA